MIRGKRLPEEVMRGRSAGPEAKHVPLMLSPTKISTVLLGIKANDMAAGYVKL